jgi:hypothetical protein
MDQELRALVSRTVTDVWQEPGQCQLCFTHGAVLTVAWPHRLERAEATRQAREALGSLVGQRLVSLSSGGDRIALEFSGGARLLVEAGEERGPGVAGLYLTTRQGRLVEWRLFDEEAA